MQGCLSKRSEPAKGVFEAELPSSEHPAQNEHPENELSQMDLEGFGESIEKLRKSVYGTISPDDFAHLRRVERWGRIATAIGYLTAWIIPNPITAFALALGQSTRWLLAHHITHRGYDRVPGIPARYTSRGFAKGWRRYIDWFDWIEPAAWDYEHNQLHHYHTAEETDPDQVERHVDFLRSMKIPIFIKQAFLAVVALTWKYTYYAPKTMSVLDPDTRRRIKSDHILYISICNVFNLRSRVVRSLWQRSYLPYFSWHFLVIPCLFLPLGTRAAVFVLINKILAECIANLHSFLVIGPNHTADDLYRFDFHYRDRKEFYATQVLSSANFHCGNDFVDYMSLWLNYQIEHHLFPDLPMTKYRELQPVIKALCEQHGIPYRQESVWKRFSRMADVCVGKTSGMRLQSLPAPRDLVTV